MSPENAWLTGFFAADECANILIHKKKNSSVGYSTTVVLDLTQRDPLLLNLIKEGFCSFYSKPPNVTSYNTKATLTRPSYFASKFRVRSREVLPIFFKYFTKFNFQGRKYDQVLKIQRCFNLMRKQKQITAQGLALAFQLKKNHGK